MAQISRVIAGPLPRAQTRPILWRHLCARSGLRAYFAPEHDLNSELRLRVGRSCARPGDRAGHSARASHAARAITSANRGLSRLISAYLALSRRLAGASSLYLRPTRARRGDLNPPCAQRRGCFAPLWAAGAAGVAAGHRAPTRPAASPGRTHPHTHQTRRPPVLRCPRRRDSPPLSSPGQPHCIVAGPNT